ncbi:MAG: aminotransferase class I/II-fold pyridoxal phosphate-dependent enzyme [Clostridia bacterium]
MYEELGIRDELIEKANIAEQEVKEEFERINKIAEQNSIKVLKAFQKYNLSEMHFGGTTGYGYGDVGRDTIESIFAEVLATEDALVRTQLISGTHALTVALFAMLRPGDTMLSINGKPYDTLDEVIGITPNSSSLKAYGVKYEQIDLIANEFDVNSIKKRLEKQDVKLVCMQRSRGYSTRKSLSIESMKNVIDKIREVNKNVIIMVDNCYGEFVDVVEPSSIGADLIIGSLIKNLGGGIVPNGAYIAGKKDLISLCAERLTVPGQGKEVGASLGINKQILQGLFFAPQVVASSVKTAVFASKLLENLGYKVDPKFNEKRTDIVQTIQFGDKDKLIKFCQGIQKGSPVDSNSIPEPWDMPGYTDKVIMAAGAFTQGSSIELSCDAPIREPFIAFMQGRINI